MLNVFVCEATGEVLFIPKSGLIEKLIRWYSNHAFIKDMKQK